MLPSQVSSDPVVYVKEVIQEEALDVTWQEVFETLPHDLQQTAKCESGLNPDAQNPYSTASGVLQFLDGTFAWVWEETRDTPVDWTLKNDPFIQMEFAMWLYDRYHLSHWEYPCGTLNA